jgi:plasmid stabilization system protein ParE
VKVRILPSAKNDLRRGIRFYEMQEPGLGGYFLDALSAEVDSLQILAGIHPMRRENHRFLADRFPFWIYYRVEDNTVWVVAVLDARQDPAKIEKREIIEQKRASFLRNPSR